MMQGYPTSAKLPEEFGFGERFWYWRGASGRSYIHSIYKMGSGPPSPGAVFVLVRGSGGSRRPLAVGRFPNCVDGRSNPAITGCHEADEIHIHLLARDNAAAEAVQHDLEEALHGSIAVVASDGCHDPAAQSGLLLGCD